MSVLGQREKWRDRSGYQQRTIERALLGCGSSKLCAQRDQMPAKYLWLAAGKYLLIEVGVSGITGREDHCAIVGYVAPAFG